MGSWLKAITKATGMTALGKTVGDAWDSATGNTDHKSTASILDDISPTFETVHNLVTVQDNQPTDATWENGKSADTGGWEELLKDPVAETQKTVDAIISGGSENTQDAVKTVQKEVNKIVSPFIEAASSLGSDVAHSVKKYAPYVLAAGAAVLVWKFAPKR